MDDLFPTHIRRLILTNHKCFYEPTEFEFDPGFNILVGENSSGKSTVLEALDPASQPSHHHSLRNEISEGVVKPGPSIVEVHYAITPYAIAKLTQLNRIYVGNRHPGSGQVVGLSDEQWHELLQENHYLSFEALRSSADKEKFRLKLGNLDCPWQDPSGRAEGGCAVLSYPQMKLENSNEQGSQPAVWDSVRKQLQKRTYRFLTERRIAPFCGFSDAELAADGSNLAFCLNHLKSNNGSLHRDLNRCISYILPAIKSVNAIPENNGFTIKINRVDDEENRGDLAVNLSQVGTGVGNVVAMLYVALTAQHPRTILLEEPNSYLHPRALRELLAILADTEVKHQYFITTHSSDVLRSVKASTVTHLEYDGETSSRKQVKGDQIGELKSGLMDMGIRLSDLHGCDRVMWVEGQTEEAVFPLLIRKYFGETASSTAVLRVHATSDFEGEVKAHHLDPLKVAEIYKKLSTGNALAPHMVGIVLDRESRPKTQCDKIEKESNGQIHFLARPMLEDYLLHPGAICNLIHDRAGVIATADEIATRLEAAKSKTECWLKPNAKSSDVHAAKVLKLVCNELTEGKFEYSKTHDGPYLVEHILKYDVDALSELRALLRKVLSGK